MVKKRYWLPLTYGPKIQGVQDGTIRQTIRPGRKFKPGDEISFHGWEGVPYKSPWSFRFGPYSLHAVLNVVLYPDGIKYSFGKYPWSSRFVILTVKADGIDPPTGEALEKVMKEYHRIPDEGLEAQILRW